MHWYEWSCIDTNEFAHRLWLTLKCFGFSHNVWINCRCNWSRNNPAAPPPARIGRLAWVHWLVHWFIGSLVPRLDTGLSCGSLVHRLIGDCSATVSSDCDWSEREPMQGAHLPARVTPRLPLCSHRSKPGCLQSMRTTGKLLWDVGCIEVWKSKKKGALTELRDKATSHRVVKPNNLLPTRTTSTIVCASTVAAANTWVSMYPGGGIRVQDAKWAVVNGTHRLPFQYKLQARSQSIVALTCLSTQQRFCCIFLNRTLSGSMLSILSSGDM